MCATLINHGERLIMPSSHYMHSPINAVNELPLLTYDATTVWPRTYIRCRPTPSRGDGVGVQRPRGPGCCRWHGGTSQDGTLHMRQNSGGGVRVRARARVGVWVCVRACMWETVCAITFVSVFLQFCSSWSWDRLWASRSERLGWGW